MERFIKVTGEAKISVKPDVTRITMAVYAVNESYASAMDELENKVNRIKTELSKLRENPDELRMSSFNVTSEYEGYQDEKGIWRNRFTGYRANQDLILELGVDNARTGRVLSAVSSSGAQPELRIAFIVKDTEKAKERLIKNAVRDSRKKAKLICDAAGVGLGEVVTVNYSFGDTVIASPTAFRIEANLVGSAKAMGADVAPRDIDLSDSVTVVWSIV